MNNPQSRPITYLFSRNKNIEKLATQLMFNLIDHVLEDENNYLRSEEHAETV